jgi:hypothetical protein
MPGLGVPGAVDVAELARRLARFAVGDERGDATRAMAPRVGFADPVYRSVTEGRQDEAARLEILYSSCGDLPHWLYARLGVRLWWLNRAELFGWKPVVNIWRLVGPLAEGCSGLAERVTPDSEGFEVGDALHVGDTDASAHACVVLEDEAGEERRALLSADYGLPGGGLVGAAITVRGGRLFRGSRPIVHVLRLSSVLLAARDSGALVEPSLPAGFAW